MSALDLCPIKPKKSDTQWVRILEFLAVSEPLYTNEISTRLGISRSNTTDALAWLYNRGAVAKAAPRRGVVALWTTANRAHELPEVNVHVPVKPYVPTRAVVEPEKRPSKIEPRKIAHMRSIFDWAQQA